MSADRAHAIVVSTVAKHDWREQIIVTRGGGGRERERERERERVK